MSSWLSNAAKAIKKGVVDTGHFVGQAQNNKWVKGLEAAGLAATGVGAPAAAALMGGAGLIGGAIRPGGGLKGAITQGAQGALTGGIAGEAGSLGRMAASHFLGGGGGAGAAGDVLPQDAGTGGDSGIPGLGSVEGLLGKLGGIGGIAGKVGDFLGGNGGMNALATAQGVNQALLQQKSNEYAKNALGTAQASYDSRAPLRTAGIAGMLNPAQGIAPRIAALPQGPNPYAPKGGG